MFEPELFGRGIETYGDPAFGHPALERGSDMSMIKIAAADRAGEFGALLVAPAQKPAGAVVVIQEIFGINDAMRATCQQIADMGFFALCPDLFWRIEPGVDITDKTDAEWQRAFALMKAFDQDKGVEDLQTAVTAARQLPGATGKVGTIGFCLGGRLAAMMALRSDADVNISYYGVGLDGMAADFAKIRTPLLIHIAEKDEFSSPEANAAVAEVASSNVHVEAFVYPGVQHAFARVGGIHFDARAATIANGRSASLMADILG